MTFRWLDEIVLYSISSKQSMMLTLAASVICMHLDGFLTWPEGSCNMSRAINHLGMCDICRLITYPLSAKHECMSFFFSCSD